MSRASVWLQALLATHAVFVGWVTHSSAQDVPNLMADARNYYDADDPAAYTGPSSEVRAQTTVIEHSSGTETLSGAAASTHAPATTSPTAAASTSPLSAPAAFDTKEATPPPVAASPSTHWGSTRVLGGHSFLLGTFVQSGLINSHLGVRAGLEYHQVPGYVRLPSLVNSGPQAVQLRTINVAETLDFAVRLHDHVALFGDGYGKARVGANINTLLGTGADYTYGGRLGLLVKLFHLSSFQISVSGQAGYYAGQSAGILALFQDLNTIAREAVQEVETNPVIDPNKTVDKLNTAFRTATADLLTPFEGFTYGFALNIAQAIGPYFGLQGSLGYNAESATYRPTRYDPANGGPVVQEHTVSTRRPTVGIIADFDANPAGLPFAVLIEYRATPASITDTQDATQLALSSLEQLIALGLFYSGRTDLQLGVTTYSVYGQLPTLNAQATTSGKPLVLAAQLVFRYFW